MHFHCLLQLLSATTEGKDLFHIMLLMLVLATIPGPVVQDCQIQSYAPSRTPCQYYQSTTLTQSSTSPAVAGEMDNLAPQFTPCRLCIETLLFTFHFRSLWNCSSSFIQFACNCNLYSSYSVLVLLCLFSSRSSLMWTNCPLFRSSFCSHSRK